MTDCTTYIHDNKAFKKSFSGTFVELNKDYHRSVGKTTFICRLLMYYVIEDVASVVVRCKTANDAKIFKDKFVIPALTAEPTLRYRVKSKTEIEIGGPYNTDVFVRRPDTCIIFKISTDDVTVGDCEFYRTNGYKVIYHDSSIIDLRMVNELKILREPDEKLPLYVDHKWTFELLHQDYLERLKKNTSFAVAI